MKWKLVKKISLMIFALILFSHYASTQENETIGKKLFADKKCSTCHSIQSHGIVFKNKTKAPDLSAIGSKLTADFIKKYVLKEEKLDGVAHMFLFKGEPNELDSLANWLESLKEPVKADTVQNKNH
jgi:mono/diheme cytochrome c family protein